MDLAARVDPELLPALQAIPAGGTLNWQDLPGTRASRLEVFRQSMVGVPDLPNLTKEDRTIPGRAGDPDVPVRIYRPTDRSGPRRRTRTASGEDGAVCVGGVAGE